MGAWAILAFLHCRRGQRETRYSQDRKDLPGLVYGLLALAILGGRFWSCCGSFTPPPTT